MPASDLDDIDRGILYCLQLDARNTTSKEMGNELGVAASTIRNRLSRLEDEGIISGYVPEIDYVRSGFPLHVLFTATTPNGPEDVGRRILDAEGVVTVRELLAGTGNIHIEAVGTSIDHLTEIAKTLREMDLEIVRTDLLKSRRTRPFDRFGEPIAGAEK